MYTTPSKLDLELISGYLMFPAGVTTQTLVLSSLDDQEEEAEEVFSVRLISASGGARVAHTYNMAIVTGNSIVSNTPVSGIQNVEIR